MAENNQENKFEKDPELYGTKVVSVPKPEQNIGIDTKGTFYDNIIGAGLASQLDLSTIESFSQTSQNRNLIYNVLDIMAEDPTVSSVLEVYAEDATEANDAGHIVWAESDDILISKYINFLLDIMNVDKHIYG